MKDFRKDINGLRCIAVLAVLFYHFAVPGFTSGYIGVDVFFVISGYLMTGIILSRLEQNNFSLIDFWLSRARRILPALGMLLIAVLAFGWVWLPPYAYKVLARFAVASLLFISNIIFKNETGNYFGDLAIDNWLLHTWSLSVEWQFYFIFPLILMAAYQTFKSSKAVHAIVLVWFLVSLGYCLYKTPLNQASAFYFLSTRTWEFLAGAGVYILLQRFKPDATMNRLLESAGLLMILASVFVFQQDTRWPGYQAILPVLGTALVIAAGNRNALWSNNVIVENIGKWSYSIYLWHWPLIVGLRFFEFQANNLVYAVALLLSILMGGLSYYGVENPVRKSRWSRAQSTRYALAAVSGLVLAAGIIMQNQGLPGRVPAAVAMIDQEIEKESIGDCKIRTADRLRECIFGNQTNITVAVWGDSHAQATVPGITKAAELHGQGVLYYNMPGCPPIIGAKFVNRDRDKEHECILFNEIVFHRLQALKDISVIIVGRFSHHVENSKYGNGGLIYFNDYIPDSLEERRLIFQNHLVETLCTIAAGRKVHVLKPIPEMWFNVPRKLSKSLMLTTKIDEIFITYDDYMKQNSVVLAALDTARDKCGVNLLDPVPYLCKDNKCLGVLNDRPLYSDSNHLSNYGNQVLLPLFASIFN